MVLQQRGNGFVTAGKHTHTTASVSRQLIPGHATDSVTLWLATPVPRGFVHSCSHSTHSRTVPARQAPKKKANILYCDRPISPKHANSLTSISEVVRRWNWARSFCFSFSKSAHAAQTYLALFTLVPQTTVNSTVFTSHQAVQTPQIWSSRQRKQPVTLPVWTPTSVGQKGHHPIPWLHRRGEWQQPLYYTWYLIDHELPHLRFSMLVHSLLFTW